MLKKKREKEKLDNLILECFEVKPKKLLILTRVFFSFRRSSSLKPLIYESISTQFRPYPIKKTANCYYDIDKTLDFYEN